MHVARAVKTGQGNIKVIMPLLTAWYSIRKFYRKGKITYYLIADEESLNIFEKIFKWNGYEIKCDVIKDIPWYLEELITELKRHAVELELKRKCLHSILNEGILVKDIPNKFSAMAKELGIKSTELTRIAERISKSMLVEFNPRIELEEFMKYAVKVGLLPLTNRIYYSGGFFKNQSKYDKVIDKLEIPPYSEFNNRIKDFLVSMYGLEAKKVLQLLRSGYEYQQVLARSKVKELSKMVTFDYKIFTLS